MFEGRGGGHILEAARKDVNSRGPENGPKAKTWNQVMESFQAFSIHARNLESKQPLLVKPV